MKKILVIMVLGALMAYLVPAKAQNAQQEQWQTSTMQGSGSAYAPQVSPVGATSAVNNATTTESYSPAKVPNGPHKSIEYHDDLAGDPGSPVGDAMLPLMLMALAFVGGIAIRRRKAEKA